MSSHTRLTWVSAAALGLAACGSDAPTDSRPTIDDALCQANEPVAIGEIQGSELRSEMIDQTVTVAGIVTLELHDDDGMLGMYVQASRGDGNPRTSDALFVRTDQSQPLGTLLYARGVIAEFGAGRTTRTALEPIAVAVCGEVELPEATAITLPIRGRHIEALEGMRVSLSAPVTISGLGDLGWRGELTVSSGGRLFQPTERFAPGDQVGGMINDNRKRSLTLDDGSLRTAAPQAVVRKLFGNGQWPRAGDQLSAIEGVLDHFAGYRLHLTETPALTTTSARPALPTRTSGNLRVASFNLLNYFNGDGQGGSFPTSRGADSAMEFDRQRRKLASAASALGAELFALAELENDGFGPASAIASFTAAVNQQATTRRYQHVAHGDRLGDDEIAVGFVYDAAQLTPDGPAQTTAEYPFDDWNRQPLAQRFVHQASGQSFTVVALHLKSKGCGEEVSGDNLDQRDGQGCWNHKRGEAAQFLLQWVERIGADPERTMLIGDFNAYTKEAPIQIAEQGGYRSALQGTTDDYSFIFRGAAGSLDHALLGTELHQSVVAAQVWHINADESDWRGYNVEGKSATEIDALYRPDAWRSSDHDPLVVDLQFD